jgi:hypothetical protein
MSISHQYLFLSIVIGTIIGATIDFNIRSASSEVTTASLRFLVPNSTYAEFVAELK